MTHPPLQRTRFGDTPGGPQRRVLDLLLAQDGSTTRLCEMVAGGAVQLHLLGQRVIADGAELPDIVPRHLPAGRVLQRFTCLAAHGEVMMDNLSYTVLDGREPTIEAGLLAGIAPIGHLLAGQWVRRDFIDAVHALAPLLWSTVGLPDPAATRTYCMVTPNGNRMLIAETFRGGMLMARPGGA